MNREEMIRKVKAYLADYLPWDCVDEYDEIVKALESSIPIPSGATNGDVIKAVFSDIKGWVLTDHKEIIALNYKEVVDWWNAPYKAEGEK